MNQLLSLSFISPIALIAIPIGLAGLLLIYKKHQKNPAVVVPSLIILRSFTTTISPHKKKYIPLRLLFDLFLIILAAFGLAGLYQKPTGDIETIIIDNSLSMGYSSDSAESLLQGAKDAAIKYANKLSSDTRLKIFETCPSLRLINETPLQPKKVQGIIKNISLCYGKDGINNALLTLPSYGKIKIFTDHPPDLGDSFTVDSQISSTVIKSYPEAENIGFTSFEKTSDGGALATISNNFSTSVQARVQITSSYTTPSDTNLTIPTWRDLISIPVTLTPKKPLSLPISSEIFKPDSIIKITINNGVDGLSYDNTIYVTQVTNEKLIKVISPLPHKSLSLPNFKNLSFSQPNTLKNQTTSGLIYHRTNPAQALSLPHIIIMPPKDSSLITSDNDSVGIISTWNERHEITRYIDPGSIKFSNYRTLAAHLSLDRVFAGPRGPLLLAGEENGVRKAIVGFELLPFEGQSSLSASILFLNIASWVFNVNLNQSESVNNKGLTIQHLTALESSVKNAESLALSQVKADQAINIPGLYRVTMNDDYSQIIAVNNFLPEETIDRPATLSFPKRIGGRSQEEIPPKPLINQITMILGFLLLIETLFRAFSIFKNSYRSKRTA
jgi:hypothetical protein